MVSPHTRRNYAKALDDLFLLAAGRPLSRALLMEYRAAMDALSPSTVNVRLSAVRKTVFEARKNGMLGAEEAANLTEVPNIPQKGTRLGNWLTREQARELLAVPDRTTLKGKRDYVVLAMQVGCALRREELAGLDVGTIQLREGRWVLADLEGKGAGFAPWRFRRGSTGSLSFSIGKSAAGKFSKYAKNVARSVLPQFVWTRAREALVRQSTCRLCFSLPYPGCKVSLRATQ